MSWEDTIKGIENGSITKFGPYFENLDPDKLSQLSAAILSPKCKLTNFYLFSKLGEDKSLIILRALSKLNRLTSIRLSDNQFGDQGAYALIEVIDNNPQLTKLEISDNLIGNEGLKALAASLSRKPFLEVLSLSNNKFTSEVVNDLSKALSTNVSLNYLGIQGNQIKNKELINLLQAISDSPIHQLNLSRNQLSRNAPLFSLIETSTNLTNLDVSSNSLCGDRIILFSNALSANNSLSKLNLSENNLRGV